MPNLKKKLVRFNPLKVFFPNRNVERVLREECSEQFREIFLLSRHCCARDGLGWRHLYANRKWWGINIELF